MAGRILEFKKGDAIIKQGQNEQRMYIILKGEVRIVLQDDFKEVQLAILKKNDFFGEISLFNNTRRCATAIALEKVSCTFIDSTEELDRFLTLNPGFCRKMVKILAGRLAQTDDIIRDELGGKSKASMGFMWN
jgi:CRP/FNR family transcriptional regulator, cyclic AMP receptor protein